MNDLLIISTTLGGCLSLVSWGSEKAQSVFLKILNFCLCIKFKISKYTNVFVALSMAINLYSGVYAAYIIFSDKDLQLFGPFLGYVFFVNVIAALIGVFLYFLNLPVKLICVFLAWTMRHDIQTKWKIICAMLMVVPAVYQVAYN